MRLTWIAAGLLAGSGLLGAPESAEAGTSLNVQIAIGDPGRGHYQDRYGPNPFRIGFERGYREGLREARRDIRRHGPYGFRSDGRYRKADSGYRHRHGPRRGYQAGYRSGYEAGYRNGFRAVRYLRRGYGGRLLYEEPPRRWLH